MEGREVEETQWCMKVYTVALTWRQRLPSLVTADRSAFVSVPTTPPPPTPPPPSLPPSDRSTTAPRTLHETQKTVYRVRSNGFIPNRLSLFVNHDRRSDCVPWRGGGKGGREGGGPMQTKIHQYLQFTKVKSLLCIILFSIPNVVDFLFARSLFFLQFTNYKIIA